MNYKAYRVFETGEERFLGEITELKTDDLPAGDVLVQVLFSYPNLRMLYPHPEIKALPENFRIPRALMR